MLRITGVLGLLASCVLLALPASAQESAQLQVEPKPAPALAFIDAGGKTHRVADDKGTLTAVHFWATWCVPCVGELPQVDAAQAAYAARGFKVIALSLDGDNLAKVQKFLADHHILHLAPNLDQNMSAFQAVHAPGLPTTVFIDAAGNEIARAEGPLDWKKPEVTQFIESHLIANH